MAISDIKSIRTYADALATWARIKPWRGESEHSDRTLDPLRRSRNWTIRQLNDGSIACKLYRTDVVTYHPNGEVTIAPWGSMSTDHFMARVAPERLGSSFNGAVSMFMIGGYSDYWCNRVAYRAAQATTFRPDPEHHWVPTTEVTPWVDARLNRKRGNKALKDTRYAEFEVWAKAARSMAAPDDQMDYRDVSPTELLRVLTAGPAEWPQILWHPFDDMRETLYRHFDCVDRVSRDWVPLGEVQNIMARLGKWGRG